MVSSGFQLTRNIAVDRQLTVGVDVVAIIVIGSGCVFNIDSISNYGFFESLTIGVKDDGIQLIAAKVRSDLERIEAA